MSSSLSSSSPKKPTATSSTTGNNTTTTATGNNSSSSVQVVVRLRPLNSTEQKHATLPVVKASTRDRTVTVLKGSGKKQLKQTYKFDNVFTAFSTQGEVFEQTLQPVIKDVLNGYESTVFAYGQTGTGKTHTMEGNLDEREEYGVIPRSAELIFSKLQTDPQFVEHKVYCSFLEIYNEELCDLLVGSSSSSSSSSSGSAAAGVTKQQHKLAIMEGPNGPFCRGLSEQQVESSDDLLQLMRQAQQQRQVGETNMNKQSSRSHCIFTLRVEAKRQLADSSSSGRGSVLEVGGKLHCVDLAGSECAKSANLDGTKSADQAARERERMNINRSLLTLGRVVSTLKELSQGKSSKQKNVRIPYRDSKLTRILQESLGGRCKTCLIATVSPSVTAIEESLSTLNYAQAANGIINKPVTTSSMTVSGSGVGAAAGASSVGAGGGGAVSVEHWQEMEVRLQYMQSQVDEAQQALARKHIQHQEFLERAEKAEGELKEEQEQHQLSLEKIDYLQDELLVTKNRAEVSEQHLKETKVLLDATRQTEVSLTKEASELLSHLKNTIAAGENLHSELVERRDDDMNRRDATKVSTSTQIKILEDVITELTQLGEKQKTFHSNLLEQDSSRKSQDLTKLDHHLSIVDSLKTECQSQLETIRGNLHKGILESSFQPFVESVRESLVGLHDSTKELHNELEQHCQELHDGLDEQLAELKTHQESYKSNSDDLGKTIGSHFESTHTRLEQNASTSIETYQRDLHQRNKLSDDALTSLQSWKSSCDDCIADVTSITGSNLEQIKTSVGSFADECKEHREGLVKNFDKQLVEQSNHREAYIKMLEEQNRHLQEQHDAMVNAKAEQERRNELLMSNVMSKVQATLQHEMDSMRTFQQEKFQQISTTHTSLKSTNETLVQTTKGTFDVLDSNVSKLSNETMATFDVQDRFCRDLTDQLGSFGSEVDESLPKHQDALDRYAQQSTQALQSGRVQDKSSTDAAMATIRQELESNKQSIASDRETIRNSLVDLNNASNDTFSFVVSEIVEPTQATIDKTIRDRICEGGLTTHSQVDGIVKLLSTGETIMENETNRQIESTNRLGETISESIGQKLQPSINEHKSDINDDVWLKTAAGEYENDFEKNVDSINSEVNSAKEHTQDLAKNIIKVDEDVPEVQDHSQPKYSTSLSATPSDEELLQGLHDGDDNDMTPDENENVPPTKSSRLKKASIATSTRPSSSSIPVLKMRSSRDGTNIKVAGRRDDDDDHDKEATNNSPGHKRPVSEADVQDQDHQESEDRMPSASTTTTSGGGGAVVVVEKPLSSRNKRARTTTSSSIPSSK
mmetsp:Transcript_34161/g.82231  ORF Transcript_34161/g.82231 Transcript_34161/m.82231 type:complete len:1318 (+) Transcript_34161:147-4100(+)